MNKIFLHCQVLTAIGLLMSSPAVLADEALAPPNIFTDGNVDTSFPSAPKPLTPLRYDEAQVLLQEGSPALKASQFNVESKTHAQDALKLLGGPVVTISGNTGYMDVNGHSTFGGIGDDVQVGSGALGQVEGMVPPNITNEIRGIGVKARVHEHYQFADVTVAVPLYTGGKITAAKEIAKGGAKAAKAEDRGIQADVQAQLIARYFGAQLAQSAANLTQDAVAAITVHDKTAQRMLDTGLIANVERLQVKVALETSKRVAEKAKNDAILASAALQRLLQSQRQILPTTALFINQKPLPKLDYFVDLAMQNHPGLAQIAAKKEQSEAVHKISQSRWKPDVLAFARHEINARNPNRMVGVNLRWTLWSAVDRRLMDRASLATINEVNMLNQQAREDISILVEKNWRDVENARYSYTAMSSNIQAAQEYLRLRQASLREGLSPISDVIDAQVNLTKAKTERLEAANSYIQALSALLNSAGIPEQFSQYLNQADTKVKP